MSTVDWVRRSLLVSVLTLTTVVAGWPRVAPGASAPNTAVGVSPTTVTIAGIVGTDSGSAGAEIGARARLARANRSGGVASRTVEYSGNVANATAASNAFAVVPAVSDTLDAVALAQSGLPFVGSAATLGWEVNRFGFGFSGAQAVLQTRVVNPAWGVLLRSLLGTAQGSQVALAVDGDALGAARAEQARISLRAAGFRVGVPLSLPPPPAPLPDLAAVAARLAMGSPAVVLLLTSQATTSALTQQLTQLAFTGTVAAGAAAYQPTMPERANGLTVLLPYAPVEQSTAANRRLAGDVEAYAPGTAVTPGVIAGYWSADLFLAMLRAVGKELTRERFLAVARRFSFAVPRTVGRVTWPAMHSQAAPCGALVQSDGSEYFVAEPYRCGTPLVQNTKKRSPTTR